jgi:hypothetical protein
MTDFGLPPSAFPVPPTPVPPTRLGPPWENEGPLFQRFIDTAKGVLIDPMNTFAQMRREGGLGPPLTYYLLGMLVGIGALFVWMSLGFGGIPRIGEPEEMAGAAFGLGIFFVWALVAWVIGIFIGSGITHLCLMLFGGANHGFETTFRTVAYTHGSVLPILLLPLCGAYVVSIWGIVVTIIGLSQMHETTIGKAAAGVLVPYAICCALFVITLLAIFGLAILGVAHGLRQ